MQIQLSGRIQEAYVDVRRINKKLFFHYKNSSLITYYFYSLYIRIYHDRFYCITIAETMDEGNSFLN